MAHQPRRRPYFVCGHFAAPHGRYATQAIQLFDHCEGFAMLFDFGQPTDGLIQMAFVVEDLDAAMARFSESFRVGPWTVLRDFAGENPRYRGEPSQARAHVALGFGGHMQYELIQPADELPSVHRDVITQQGYGFHHFGYATTAFDETVEAMHRKGYETVFSASVGSDSRVAYFDTRDVLPGMTELIEASPGLDATFTDMYKASLSTILPDCTR